MLYLPRLANVLLGLLPSQSPTTHLPSNREMEWEVGARLHVGNQGLECPSQTLLLATCKVSEQNKDEHDQLSVAQYNFGLVPIESQLPQPPPIFIPDFPPDPKHRAETNDQDDLNWEDVQSSSFSWVPLQTTHSDA